MTKEPHDAAYLERFYDLLDQLSAFTGGPHCLGDFTPPPTFPSRGLYFFFEPSEQRSVTSALRVVRVGTHQVSHGSRSLLWSRLKQHRGSADGSGGHRGGSIYRYHVGRSIVSRDDSNPVLPPTHEERLASIVAWALSRGESDPARADKLYEAVISTYITRMSFTYVSVGDEPSKRSDRAYLEKNAIALLSTTGRSIDPPSQEWLGLHSPYAQIRESGMWNKQHVGKVFDRRFLETFETYVNVTCGNETAPLTSIAPAGWI